MASNVITMETDWGARGANLTGAQVQTFIKSKLIELFDKDAEQQEQINSIGGQTTPTINVADLDSMCTNTEEFIEQVKESSKLYNVVDNNDICVGRMLTFSDNMHHVLTQVLFSHYTTEEASRPGENGHASTPSILWRSYSYQGHHNINSGTWSEWKDMFAQGLSDLEYSLKKDIIPTINKNELDIEDMSALQAIRTEGAKLYNVIAVVDDEEVNVGRLMMMSDNMKHSIVQYLISFYSPTNPPSGDSHENHLSTMYRVWSSDGVHGPAKQWSAWKDIWNEHFDDYLENNFANYLLNDTHIVQASGNKTDSIMSQASVTALIKKVCQKAGVSYNENATTGEITITD